tara:strand:- start:3 stop:221 length:219 start_codon:yes stop_codon:yes gene_type:complete
MPFQVIKDGDKFKLKKIDDGKIINKTFNSKESAINMAKRYMEYRKEQNIRVVGNKILGTKLSDIKKKKDKNK